MSKKGYAETHPWAIAVGCFSGGSKVGRERAEAVVEKLIANYRGFLAEAERAPKHEAALKPELRKLRTGLKKAREAMLVLGDRFPQELGATQDAAAVTALIAIFDGLEEDAARRLALGGKRGRRGMEERRDLLWSCFLALEGEGITPSSHKSGSVQRLARAVHEISTGAPADGDWGRLSESVIAEMRRMRREFEGWFPRFEAALTRLQHQYGNLTLNELRRTVSTGEIRQKN